MRVDIAIDRTTGFPCVRTVGMDGFIALAPFTKLQAENWLYCEDGIAPEDMAPLVKRLSGCGLSDDFPPGVRKLGRVATGKLRADNVLGAIATNLSLWTEANELRDLRTTFPTPSSEWGRLLAWLGGRVPSYAGWQRAKVDFAAVRTLDLFDRVLKRPFSWPPAVKDLLWKLRELVGSTDRGLPFIALGLYELIAETEEVDRMIGGLRKEVRPRVAGNSRVWPSLTTADTLRWRGLRNARLPFVALRPWFSELDIVGFSAGSAYESVELPELLADSPAIDSQHPPPVKSGPRLTPLVSSPGRMARRCPFCHELVSSDVFRLPSFDCLERGVEITDKDGTKSVKKVRVHEYVPAMSGGTRVSAAYLKIASKHPDRIRTVADAGYTEAGKTTWFISFGGLADYPDGISRLFAMFPSEWNFEQWNCSLYDLYRGGGAVDRREATEAMWVDGKLPARNPRGEKAARDLVYFRTKPGLRERDALLILDDMAGELTTHPDMVNNENFPHFASVSDVIWVMPVSAMNVAVAKGFKSRLEQAQQGGVPIDLKAVNLIFAISKIDELKYGGPEQRDLLDRILPDLYSLPRRRDKQELRAYVTEMEQVHRRIEQWLQMHKPEIFGFLNHFGSYRCCGFSAFGFEPLREGNARYEEASLPFGPDPVRVVDPVLWLLKENGLISI